MTQLVVASNFLNSIGHSYRLTLMVSSQLKTQLADFRCPPVFPAKFDREIMYQSTLTSDSLRVSFRHPKVAKAAGYSILCADIFP
ncbi:hypothetical protein EDC04DRAFT_2893373 [Pisolithus marmoratus]|nr:hypothetical protein EDC04DRAFT_2893373 [Pisolithus marmoratus]